MGPEAACLDPKERARLKRDKALEKFQASEKVKDLIKPFTKTEQKRFLKVGEAVSKIPETTDEDIERAVESVVNAQSDKAVREMMEAIEEQDDAFQDQVWAMVHEFGLVDARRLMSIVEARLATIRKLQEAIHQGAREVPDIHNLVAANPWLLDPRWNIVDDEVDLTKLNIAYQPELDEEGLRLDFLFALAPHAPAPLDEVIVVEIKRGTHRNGTTAKCKTPKSTSSTCTCSTSSCITRRTRKPPIVRGVMIAARLHSPSGPPAQEPARQHPGTPNIQYLGQDDRGDRAHAHRLARSVPHPRRCHVALTSHLGVSAQPRCAGKDP